MTARIKTIVGFVCLLIVITGSEVTAAGLFGLGGGGGTGGVDALSKRSASLIRNISIASISIAESLISVELAVGHKEEAEKLQQALKNAQEKKEDTNAIRALVDAVNVATDDLNKIDIQSTINREVAKENLGNAILKIGIGLIFDGLAAKDAAGLVNDAKKTLTTLSPTMLTAVGKVKDIISVASFASDVLPGQIDNVGKVSKKLVDYASANGIPTPSTEDIKAKANSMIKEG
jgi:hypothetical protein